MADLARIKGNVSKMVAQGAPEDEIDKYISLEGSNVDEVKAFKMPNATTPAPQPKNSLGDEIGHQLAMTGKGLATGAAGLLDIPFVAGGKLQELTASGIDKVTGANVADKVRQNNQQMVLPSQKIGQLIDAFNQGNATPRGDNERIAYKAAQFMGGAASGGGTGTALGRALMPSTGKQIVGLGLSGVGAGVANELHPNNPVAEMVGALAGGGAVALPSMLRTAAAKTVGISPEAVAAFDKAGVSPSIAGTSERGAGIIEKTLSEIPGSAGIVQKRASQTLQELQDSVGKLASTRGTAFTPTEAGAAIQKGAEGFAGRFAQTSEKLYDKLRDFIKPTEQVEVNYTKDYLDGINKRFDELPSLKSAFTNPIIVNAYKYLKQLKSFDPVFGARLENPKITYNTLRTLRTAVGNEMQSISLSGDQQAALKGMYSALSKDMEGAAASKGEGAMQAFRRANAYHAAGMQRMDNIIKDLRDTETPEKVFNIAMQGTKEGASTLNTIKKSLQPDEFGALQSAVIRRMGLANPSAQDASQNLFSVGSFMTRYSQLAPEAKKVLFGGASSGVQESLDNLVQVASRLKGVEKLANTSGTGRVTGMTAIGAGLVKAPVATLTLLAGSHITSRLVTNPTFTRWLANGLNKTTEQAISQHLRRLPAIAATNPDIQGDISQYLESLSQPLQPTPR